MSSSVLGLGAAALGAASMSMQGVRKARKHKESKMVKTPMPSAEDYMSGKQMLLSGEVGNEKQRVAAFFGTGPVKGATGQFFYGEAPKKIPANSFIARGPDISLQGRGVNEGSYTTSLPTYQVIRLAGQQLPTQETEPKTQKPIGVGAGKSETKFGRADYEKARSQGYTNRQILQHLNENKDILGAHNAQGAGGLYDKINIQIQDRIRKNKREDKNK